MVSRNNKFVDIPRQSTMFQIMPISEGILKNCWTECLFIIGVLGIYTNTIFVIERFPWVDRVVYLLRFPII